MKKKLTSLNLIGVPNPRQSEFFASRAKYTAYGGARGGGKSWALRRKLILMCVNYKGLRCLLLRRSFPELRENHIMPLVSELRGFTSYSELRKTFTFPNGSSITLGYCSAEADVMRYQGQEYDIIAIDEATQMSEYQFNTLKACVRGANELPKRMYLTCNPGGPGHAWVKRLFIDRAFRSGETEEDYLFIPARVHDNRVLVESSPDYISQLESLPDKLRSAWLEGRWDIFEGQYFSEFDEHIHRVEYTDPLGGTRFLAFDYGFDMTAALWCHICSRPDGGTMLTVYREFCMKGLTLSLAAGEIASRCAGEDISYAVCSPDLWNRRQESGRSGVEVMCNSPHMPPMIAADNRRVIGWRTLREYLAGTIKIAGISNGGNDDRYLDSVPSIVITHNCSELLRTLPLLQFDRNNPEDVASEPHNITHAPEALRYAVMSLSSTKESGDNSPRFEFGRRAATIADY